MRWVILAWGAVACSVDEPGGQGIAIGNPPGKEADARVWITVADGLDVTMTHLLLPLDGVYVEDCDGRGQTIEFDEPVRLALGGDPVPLPPGEWCGVGLVPSSRDAQLQGTAGEGRFRFESPLGRILLFGDGALVSAGEPLVIELAEPGWLAAQDFNLQPGEQRRLGPECVDDALCTQVRVGLMDRAGLYRDEDEDGEVSTDERESGSDARGDARQDRRDRTEE